MTPGMTPDAPFHAEIASAPDGAQAFWMPTSDGVRLRAVAWEGGARGTAVIFAGRAEYAEKYGPLAGEFRARGLSAVVVDWRGQGLSDRHPARPALGHVEDFRDYQRDVAALIGLADALDLPAPRWLVGHSMGGTIGLRTLLERADFRGAILSAPMWHLQMRAATRELTSRMTRLANLVGLGGRLTPGAYPRPSTLSVSFEANALTTDPDQFDWMVGQITAHPELALAGPSMQWTYAALEEMARLYVAPLPRVPVLAFLGTEETVVSTSVIRGQMARMEAGELVICPGARHEIFMERPETRALVWRHVDALLERASDLSRSPRVAGQGG
jgi:lysophospholipase